MGRYTDLDILVAVILLLTGIGGGVIITRIDIAAALQIAGSQSVAQGAFRDGPDIILTHIIVHLSELIIHLLTLDKVMCLVVEVSFGHNPSDGKGRRRDDRHKGHGRSKRYFFAHAMSPFV